MHFAVQTCLEIPARLWSKQKKASKESQEVLKRQKPYITQEKNIAERCLSNHINHHIKQAILSEISGFPSRNRYNVCQVLKQLINLLGERKHQRGYYFECNPWLAQSGTFQLLLWPLAFVDKISFVVSLINLFIYRYGLINFFLVIEIHPYPLLYYDCVRCVGKQTHCKCQKRLKMGKLVL